MQYNLMSKVYISEGNKQFCLKEEGTDKVVSQYYDDLELLAPICKYLLGFTYDKSEDDSQAIKSCDILDKETWKVIETFDYVFLIHQGVGETYCQFENHSTKEFGWFDLVTGEKIIIQEKDGSPRTLGEEAGIFYIGEDISWWCDKNGKTIAKGDYHCEHFIDGVAIFYDYSKPVNQKYGLMWIDGKIIIENQEYISDNYELKDGKIINYYN